MSTINTDSRVPLTSQLLTKHTIISFVLCSLTTIPFKRDNTHQQYVATRRYLGQLGQLKQRRKSYHPHVRRTEHQILSYWQAAWSHLGQKLYLVVYQHNSIHLKISRDRSTNFNKLWTIINKIEIQNNYMFRNVELYKFLKQYTVAV
jgi:hypothetical protein